MSNQTPDPEMTKFLNFMDSYYTTTENGKKILESSNRVDQVQEELNSLKAQNRKIREFQITHAERIKRIRQEVEAKLDRLTENMREVEVEKRRLIVINVNKNELTLETVKKGDSEFQLFTKKSMKDYVIKKCREVYVNFDPLRLRKVHFMKDTDRAKEFKKRNPGHASADPNKVRLFAEFYDSESAKMLLRMSIDLEKNCFREAIPFHLRQRSRILHDLVEKTNKSLPDDAVFKYKVVFGSKIQVLNKSDDSLLFFNALEHKIHRDILGKATAEDYERDVDNTLSAEDYEEDVDVDMDEVEIGSSDDEESENDGSKKDDSIATSASSASAPIVVASTSSAAASKATRSRRKSGRIDAKEKQKQLKKETAFALANQEAASRSDSRKRRNSGESGDVPRPKITKNTNGKDTTPKAGKDKDKKSGKKSGKS